MVTNPHQPLSQFTNQLQLTNRLPHQLINRPLHQNINQLLHQLTNLLQLQLTNLLPHLLINRLLHQHINQLLHPLTNQPHHQHISPIPLQYTKMSPPNTPTNMVFRMTTRKHPIAIVNLVMDMQQKVNTELLYQTAGHKL